MAPPLQSTSPAAVAAPSVPGTHPHPPPNPGLPGLPPTQLSQSHRLDLPSSAPPTRLPTAASHILDNQPARRLSRRLVKKRRDGDHPPTMELPERLKDHGDHADSEEEVLQPQGYMGGMSMNMNQSIFGLIAAAGSQVDFTDRFEGQSSDEEDEGETAMAMTIAGHKGSARRVGPEGLGGGSLAQTTVLRKPGAFPTNNEGRHHRKKLSESRILRSMSRLASKSRSKGKDTSDCQIQEEKEEDELASPFGSADASAPTIELTRTEGRLAPVMSRMLEARAQMAARPSFDLDRLSSERAGDTESSETGPSELAKRLKDIFEFEEPEEVIEGNTIPATVSEHELTHRP